MPEITPRNLDGSEAAVNTVQNISSEAVKKAAEEEKEKRQNYYIDPLEQDAKMKEKLDKIEAEKAENSEESSDSINDEIIRPDMNVSGFFSNGSTAGKTNILGQSASSATLAFCSFFGVLDAIFSAFYFIILITTGFNANWFMNWFYGALFIVSIVVAINCIRSVKVQKDDMKRNVLVGLVGSGISVIPIVTWIIHYIITIA